MEYRVLILEDEKAQQEMLQKMLLPYAGEFRIAGIASSIAEARDILAKSHVDLAFLDVQLPPHTSFELLNDLEDISFEIVFTTSYEEYAVKAFRLSALDYLVKPIGETEFNEAIRKFKERKSGEGQLVQIKALLENLKGTGSDGTKLALPTLNGLLFVKIKDIVRCESDNTYTTFFTTDKRKIIVSKTLKECEQMLSDYRFARVHNSHLINLEYITEYTKGEGGMVKMSDGSQIDVSRRRKEDFLRSISRKP